MWGEQGLYHPLAVSILNSIIQNISHHLPYSSNIHLSFLTYLRLYHIHGLLHPQWVPSCILDYIIHSELYHPLWPASTLLCSISSTKLSVISYPSSNSGFHPLTPGSITCRIRTLTPCPGEAPFPGRPQKFFCPKSASPLTTPPRYL